MKASLVWPAVEDFSGLDQTWLPHGVVQLATEANNNGHDVDILDGRLLKMDGLKTIIKDSASEIIGISMLSSLVGFSKEIFDYIKETRPDLKIVIGGIHPTVEPDDFKDWNYNWLIKGEGEITFSRILDGKVPEGVIDGEHPDLDKLCIPDRSLIRIEEKPLPRLDEPFATTIIGRGCPYNCTYCQPAERLLFGKKVRMRKAELIVNELQHIGARSCMIHDDCFTAYPEYVNEFCDLIKPTGITWWCQGRADNVMDNMQLVKKMRDCGLVGMILGHESGDDRTLKAIKKGVTSQQNVDSIRFLKMLGVFVWSNIMIGLPPEIEPPSSDINTILMIHDSQPDLTSVALFTPHPGSMLYNECKEANIILRQEDDWTYYNRGQFTPKILGPDYLFLNWVAQQIKMPEIAREQQMKQEGK